MLRRLAFFAAVIATLSACGSDKAKPKDQGDCSACGGDCLEETFAISDNHHTTDPVDYGTEPPVGGPHNPCWVPWQVYDRELQTERWVHNLEHGGVVFLYNCPDDSCNPDVLQLTSFVQQVASGAPGTALLMPYAEMDAKVAAVSWGARITLDCVDTDVLQAFYDVHLNHAPESLTANPPAGCPAP